ncbi:MAG: transposase zinc-binding domain-containing protein [Candidatus Aminicenantes bacterium]|nr:transposase zinc-binding domain-containing protein [Candidatus Aminicenantes bacterium]
MLYRVLFHNFDRFLTAYESRFEKEYGHLRPVVKEVVERYLDCGNPRSGFARIRCPDCHGEHLLTFSCKTRGFCSTPTPTGARSERRTASPTSCAWLRMPRRRLPRAGPRLSARSMRRTP